MTQDNKELVATPDRMKTPEPLSLEDIRTNTKLINSALRGLLKKGVDYGTVPGCGDKLGLFKPGSEKLMLLFKLGCFPEAKRIELSGEADEVSFIVQTRMIHLPSGLELGIGLGSASSNEEKYKWKSCTKAEWEVTDELRRRVKFYKGEWDKKKKAYGKEKEVLQVRTNPADLNNTLLKMACKRSKVDGVITVTGASDIFTQDIEPDENHGDGLPTIQQEEPLKKPESKKPAKKDIGPAPELPDGFFEMEAKFDSKCAGCKEGIKTGDKIIYNKIAKEAFHNRDCMAARTQ